MFAPSHRPILSIATLLLVSAYVHAAPMVSDVIAQPQNLPATAVAGPFTGNDVGNSPMTLNLIERLDMGLFGATPGTWTLAGSSDDTDNGPFTGNPQATAGTLTFDSAISGPFIVSLKAGNAYTAYFFDNTFTGVTSVNFTINFENNGAQTPDLSHASLFFGPNGGPVPGPGPNPIPEPASLAVFGALTGFGALAYRLRRIKHAAA